MDNIKKYESSVSFDDFIDNLSASRGCKTIGDIWEKCVTCNNCKHRAACEAISDQVVDNGGQISCKQVIDILYGELTVEAVVKN
jgi:hypothetical protein